MMTHIQQGDLQAYLDGEVTLGARSEIESHLRGCLPCNAELERQRAASRLFASVMRSSDVAAPTMPALATVTLGRGDLARRRFARSRSALAKAAVMMVGFAALASAAIPGSPLRHWISSALEAVGIVGKPAAGPTHVPAPVAPAATPVEKSEEAALSIEPAAGRVQIILTNVSPEAVIRVRLVDNGRAVVQASGSAAHARFATGPGRVEVVGVQKGEVRIDLPRSAIESRVQADGRTLLVNDHGQLILRQPATMAGNSEYVFRGRR